MERHQSIANFAYLAEFNGFDRNIAEPMAHDGCAGVCAQVTFMPRARVVGVSVGDQRTVHGAPRVDIEITGGAVDAAICEGENLGWHG